MKSEGFFRLFPFAFRLFRKSSRFYLVTAVNRLKSAMISGRACFSRRAAVSSVFTEPAKRNLMKPRENRIAARLQ
ncbi:MAG TPA: hypothetical protein VIL74_01400 [Pyrinomonadaceae bacterium]|jgi:hypothetical protein